ncbi:MAG: AAA family ATPase [Gemmatimonadetes bacterium]|nr:AAA family ATPase [Gemmatimonadota bacterium]
MTAPEPPTLELITFGAPTVRVGGEPAPGEVEWRKHLALLVYLALSPDHTHTRSQLIGMLWPETTEAKARHSLNEAVRRLRGSLGAERLQSTRAGENLTLAAAGLRVDALEFDAVADTDPDRAVELLRGDFFEGFSLNDAQAFDAWLSDRRDHYRARGVELLLEAAEQALADSRYDRARECARRALRMRPFAEAAVHLLMRTLALTDDAIEALAVYAQFAAGIGQELHEQPSKHLRDLAERIRAERWLGPSTQYADRAPPLVGRSRQCQVAFSVVAEAVATGPRSLVINADRGFGRTRLLAECTARFALEGGVVAVARPLESDHDAPWSTLRSLARGGLRDAPGVAATAPDQLATVASLVPEIHSASPPIDPRDTAEAAAALTHLFGAIAEEQPLMIAIDDAHYADPTTLEALHGALVSLSSAPVLLVVTCGQDVQDVPQELLRLRGEIGRSIPGRAIRLDPLNDGEIEELVAGLATWCVDRDEQRRLARRINFETGGSPFLAVTLLRGLEQAVTLQDDITSWPKQDATLDAPLPISVPDLARVAIIANLSAQDQSTRDVLAGASILDAAVDVEFLTKLLETSAHDVTQALEILERIHFLNFDGERYAFAAPLISNIVRQELLTHGHRRRLRERALDLLADRDDLESRLLRVRLRAETDPGRPAAEDAAAVAREAARAGAPRTARRALAAAEHALRKGTPEDAEFLMALRDDIVPRRRAGPTDRNA